MASRLGDFATTLQAFRQDLNHGVDYRDVMAEVLTQHLGVTDLSTILPGHTLTPVGFM